VKSPAVMQSERPFTNWMGIACGKRLPTPLVDYFVDVGTGTFWLAGAWLGDSLVGGPGSRPRSRLFLTSGITANHLDFR